MNSDKPNHGEQPVRKLGSQPPDQSEGTKHEARRRLTGNILSLYLLQGLNYVVPMAVLPYLVRVLGLNMYGLMAFAQSFAQYFTILTDYGFNYSATRSIARSRDDRDMVSRLFCSVFIVKFTLMLLGAAILLAVVTFVPRFHHDERFFFVAYLSVIGNTLFPVWYFQGIEQMRYISVIFGLSKLTAAVALFLFVHHPQDVLLAIAIQSCGTLAGGIAGFALSFGHFHIHLRLPRRKDLHMVLVDGFHLFISTAAISMYTNTNVFLVGMLAGNLEAGYFSAAEKLIRAMQGLITPIAQAIFPHVNLLAAQSKERALRFVRRMLRWMGLLTLVPSLLLLLLARPIAVLAFGHAGIGSVPIVRWIAMLPFLIALSNVLGVQTMISFGLDKQFSRILIAAGVFNVLLAVPLIHVFAAQGAGASVLMTEVLVCFLMLIVLERKGIRILRLPGVPNEG